MPETFDYIVVGGGTSGVIVAARLAETLDAAVCLIEAGPPDENIDTVSDYRRWPDLLGSEVDYDYQIANQARGNSSLRHARGRVLGGSSSINGAAAILPHPYDFERWVAAGASGWGPVETQRYFDRVLQRVHLDDAPTGNRCAADFNAAAAACGFPHVDFNAGPFAEGYGWFKINAKGHARQSSSVAYLHPLASVPPNLTVRTGTRALRLRCGADGGAPEVETTSGTLTAREEVVLSCGAVETPKLLLLSGIGPAEEISPHGIQVVLDLPGVGRRLTDHPEAAVIWTSVRPVPGAEEGAWVNALFARTDSGLEAPDVMIHFGTDVYQFASSLDVGPPPAPRGQSFCVTPNVPRPKSEGSIRLRAADPAVAPIVDPRYFTDPDGYDEEILLRGVELAREVVRREPLASWVDTELWPAATDRRQLSERVRGSAGTVFHLAASARMGAPDDADAVVDPQLRVRGIDGLRIADASVFPRMVGVNPAMTCMMIGERCADLIADDA